MKETKHKRQSIGKDRAIELAKSCWWHGKPDKDVARFQLFTEELCMDFGDFQSALERAVGRPVFTHELVLNFDGLAEELLNGGPAPTLEQIINLIPEDKRIILAV